MSDEQERREWERKRDDRKRLIEQVELGELEPDEAEAEAARLGVAPLAITPDPNRFDPLKETYWTILMALARIMWPDGGQVRELWDSWREQYSYWDRRRLLDGTVHAGHVLKSKGKATLGCLSTSAAVETKVNGNPPSRSVAEAREELWRALQEGKLKATGIDTTTGRRVEIPALDWLELELVEHVQDPSKGDEVRRRGLVFGGYRDVRVPSADVRSCFPAPGEKPILTETRTGLPGRPVLAAHPIEPEFEGRAATGQVADSGTQQKTDPKAPRRPQGRKKKGDGSYERLDEPLTLRGIKMYNAGEVASPEAAAEKLANEAHGSGTLESKARRLAGRIRGKIVK